MDEENKDTNTNSVPLQGLGVDELIELERLAALGYSVADMAMYFDRPLKEFKHDATTEGCVVYYHIRRGKLIIKANAAMKLMELAESGNLTATQQLAKITANNEYKDMIKQMADDEI